MLTNRQLFLEHVAQTSDAPMMIEIESASGVEMFAPDGRKYLDLISGISVSNIGHCHPDVVAAVSAQAAQFMHLMVYGEFVQSPQVKLARALTELLPEQLNSCYFVNSGSEAVEGAMKLAKRFTGRSEIIYFKNAYHGSTQGALSIMGSDFFKSGFHPLIPGNRQLTFNNFEEINEITESTAAVFIEPVQGEAGAIPAVSGYLKALADKCREKGALLVFDEIQTGFRRTGPLMAFMEADVVPDILLLAKGMGGGMPIGTFISSREILECLTQNPVLGHITTFGGHPVSCAAALATLEVVRGLSSAEIIRKGELFRAGLVHPEIKNIDGKGLLLAIQFKDETFNRNVIARCTKKGLITDWFLFAPDKMRIAPPLIIEDHQIFIAIGIILEAVNEEMIHRGEDE